MVISGRSDLEQSSQWCSVPGPPLWQSSSLTWDRDGSEESEAFSFKDWLCLFCSSVSLGHSHPAEVPPLLAYQWGAPRHKTDDQQQTRSWGIVCYVWKRRPSFSVRGRLGTIWSDEYRRMRWKSVIRVTIDPKIGKMYVSFPSHWVGKDKRIKTSQEEQFAEV